MIVKPNAVELESLSILEHNSNFQHVINWLTKSYEKSLENLMTEHDEVATRMLQGASVDLSEVISMATNARQIIEKSKR